MAVLSTISFSKSDQNLLVPREDLLFFTSYSFKHLRQVVLAKANTA